MTGGKEHVATDVNIPGQKDGSLPHPYKVLEELDIWCKMGTFLKFQTLLLDPSHGHKVRLFSMVLGLGVTGMGGKNSDAYDDLKQMVHTNSVVAGKAAGYTMGLVMLGTADANSVDKMLSYTRETHHEKIIHGLAVGVGFIYYGHQEEVDMTIKLLLAEKVCPFVQ